MNVSRMIRAGVLLATTGAVCATWALSAEPEAASAEAAKTKKAAADDLPRVPIETARDRAKVMQDIYAATLETMHHHYFHDDRARVPANAMEDIFDEISRQSKIEARWISVNTKAMSIDHEPKTDFEKAAARAITGGASEHETIEDGFYRRAVAIPLRSGCVSCHVGFFKPNAKIKHFAGLVVSIPVKAE